LTSSVHVKYKIFLSAMEYLPFSSEDDSKGSFEEIIERYELVKQNVFNCEEDKPKVLKCKWGLYLQQDSVKISGS